MVSRESRSVSLDGYSGWNHGGTVFSNVSGEARYTVEDNLDFGKGEAAAIDHALYIFVLGCTGCYCK